MLKNMLDMEKNYDGPLVLGFGNPLLDVTIVVKDLILHNKFNLPTDGQLEISEDQRPLFHLAMERNDGDFTAGGCALNTLRIFSWVLGGTDKAIFVGGIGMDERAEKLKCILSESGVTTEFVMVGDKPTGTCVALVFGAQRCLCADIGAAVVCRPEHVFRNESLEMQPALDLPHVIYLEGYFITHSFDTALKVARHCYNKGKIFIFNLCGSYVCENHSKELEQLLPYVDIIFGYIEEYKTLQKFVSLDRMLDEHSTRNIVHELKQLFLCISGEESPIIKVKSKSETMSNGEILKPLLTETNIDELTSSTLTNDRSLQPWQCIQDVKLAVVTQGPSPLLYAKGQKVFQRALAPIPPSKIIDTTGAGDSFVGGFLAACARGENLEICLDCGVWTAQQLLQERGCTVPSQPATFL